MNFTFGLLFHFEEKNNNLKESMECQDTYKANTLSVSWETSVNLKPSVVTAFTNTEMVSIGNKPSPAWSNSKALTVSMTVQT